MLKSKCKTGLLFAQTFLIFVDRQNDWKEVSKKEPGIEYQVSHPAKNSCDVSFRDLRLGGETTLTATTQYLAHRLDKSAPAKQTSELHLGGGAGLERQHLFGCETVVSVSVSGVSRK